MGEQLTELLNPGAPRAAARRRERASLQHDELAAVGAAAAGALASWRKGT
jgi:hypothetical protein